MKPENKIKYVIVETVSAVIFSLALAAFCILCTVGSGYAWD